ncbi:MAG: DCC1-like thiol-disulfide oxidoreductase family protein [Isosphaeraceae bacterium]
MRRIVSGIIQYFRDLAQATRRGWTAFFFSPADPTALGLIRVGTGLLAFWSLFVLGIDLHDYFGSRGWADPDLIWQTQRARQPWAWSFWFLVPDGWLRGAWMLCLIVLAMFTAGLFSRVTAVLSWIIVVSTVRRVPIALFGFDQVLSTLLLYLAASLASGQAVSLDRFLARWREARASARSTRTLPGLGRAVGPREPGMPRATVSANLGLRMIQLHLVFIYAMAGLAKLQGPSWWNGMALWGTMTAGEFVSRDFTSLADWPIVLNLLTHASLALELLYPFLIWVPLLRPLMLAGAVMLHLGIAWVCPGLTEFGLAMIVANLAFVPGRRLRSLATGPEQPGLRVLFDGACPRCRASMALLTAADPDRTIEPIDLTAVEVATVHPSLTRAACMQSMHVVTPTGQIEAGFDGVRAALSRLPLFWPLALAGWLPGVAWLGRRGYNYLAATRPRDVPCTDEVCGLRPPSSRASRPGESESPLVSSATTTKDHPRRRDDDEHQ